MREGDGWKCLTLNGWMYRSWRGEGVWVSEGSGSRKGSQGDEEEVNVI